MLFGILIILGLLLTGFGYHKLNIKEEHKLISLGVLIIGSTFVFPTFLSLAMGGLILMVSDFFKEYDFNLLLLISFICLSIYGGSAAVRLIMVSQVGLCIPVGYLVWRLGKGYLDEDIKDKNK